MDIPSVDRDVLTSFLASLEHEGIDVAGACAEKSLMDPRDTPGQRILIARTSPVFDAIAEFTGNEEFIYQASTHFNPDQLGILFYLTKFCQTKFDANRMVCRYSAIASDVVRFSFVEHAKSRDVIFSPNPHVYISLHQLEGILYMDAT
jgi:hypothetical protein